MDTDTQSSSILSSELPANDSAAFSLGERLIPLLLLVGEVCVAYAILLGLAIVAHFAGEAGPVLPFWGLLLVMLSFYLLAKLFQRTSRTWILRALEVAGWLLISLGLALTFVWLNNYAQGSSLFSTDWLHSFLITFIPVQTARLQFGPDALQVDITPAVQTVVFLLLAGICGWRSYRLAYIHLTSTNIDKLLKWGSFGIALIIVLFLLLSHEGDTALSPLEPALIAGGFCVCVLAARALSHASYMRRFHSAGLWGSAARQERVILQSIGLLVLAIVGIFVLIGLVYGWAGHNLVSHPPYRVPRRLLPGPGIPCGEGRACIPTPEAPPGVPDPLFLFILIVFLSLILPLLGFFAWKFALPRWRKWRENRARRRAKKRRAANAREALEGDETHESVWSWTLFLAQLKALLLALLTRARLRRVAGSAERRQAFDDLRLAEPEARSIREVYRALLKRAANLGHAREQGETPYEFSQKLKSQEALSGPQLEAITEAYVLARYSGTRPGEEEVSRIKEVWEKLKEQWM